jgi:major membrane immunogen (membrane-anchored lipoprotein)
MAKPVIPILAILLGSAALLGACGKSDEEKAQEGVCDARADIDERVRDLAALTITSASIDEVRNNLRAIREDLEKIADEQGDLEPERQQEVEEAGKRFRSQLETTAKEVVSGAARGEEAGAHLGAALDDLAQSFRKAYAPVDCS